MNIVVFEPDRGMVTISQRGGVDAGVIRKYRDDGADAVEVRELPESIDAVYVRRGELVARPAMHAKLSRSRIRANGQDVAEIRGISRGATVSVRVGAALLRQYTADGGTVHVVAAEPATYLITVEDFPHVDQEFVVEAVMP